MRGCDIFRPMPVSDEHSELRTFGRRKGHRLSARKQALLDTALPRLRLDLDTPPPAPLAGLFDRPVEAIALEIGFGAGEHLAWQAAALPRLGVRRLRGFRQRRRGFPRPGRECRPR